jgi:hypothetical protein
MEVESPQEQGLVMRAAISRRAAVSPAGSRST